MSFRRIVSLLLLAAYLPACTSYQAATQPVAELTASPKPPEHVRVTTSDGRRLVVDGARVVRDSLFGTTTVVGPRGTLTTQAVALPLVGIRTVEVRQSDGAMTAFVVAGILSVVVLAAAANCDGDLLDC